MESLYSNSFENTVVFIIQLSSKLTCIDLVFGTSNTRFFTLNSLSQDFVKRK